MHSVEVYIYYNQQLECVKCEFGECRLDSSGSLWGTWSRCFEDSTEFRVPK